MSVFIEGLIVGVATLVVGLILSTAAWLASESKLPTAQGYLWMGLVLLLTGFSVHMLSEVTGINKYYCKYGAACQ